MYGICVYVYMNVLVLPPMCVYGSQRNTLDIFILSLSILFPLNRVTHQFFHYGWAGWPGSSQHSHVSTPSAEIMDTVIQKSLAFLSVLETQTQVLTVAQQMLLPTPGSPHS